MVSAANNTIAWHSVSIHDTVLRLVAQITSRLFIGQEICRDPEWQDIAKDFSTKRVIAIQAIHAWPSLIHPVIHWFLPVCHDVRKLIRRAKSILLPIFELERCNRKSGRESNNVFSTLSFIDEYANGRPYDPTMAQLRLTGVSIHSTSDLVKKVIARICEHSELIPALRAEIISAAANCGLQHSSLLKMPLMESIMKETQRLEPPALSP
jgi:fumitremorgin C monooxygenase